MWDSVRFWLDRGVDGYRIDALGTIFEDPELEDHTSPYTLADLINLRYEPGSIPGEPGDLWDALAGSQRDLPGVHDVMKTLRGVLEEYDDRVLVGETGELSYHGDGSDELQLVFNFPLCDVKVLTPEFVRANQRTRLPRIPDGAWPCNTFNNHDRDRIRSRLDGDGNGEGWAKVTGSIALLLKGTPSLYQGEEIGMENLYLDRPEQLVDPIGIWFHGALIEEKGLSAGLAMDRAAHFSRDKCRTPMQWSSDANAGFSPDGVTTWLPVHANHTAGVNVADQRSDAGSVLNHYRDLIHLRREHSPLQLGDQELLADDHETVLAFARSLAGDRIVVAVNLSAEEQTITLGHLTQLHGEATSDAGGEWTIPPFGTFVGAAG